MSGLKPRPPKQNRCNIFQIRSLRGSEERRRSGHAHPASEFNRGPCRRAGGRAGRASRGLPGPSPHGNWDRSVWLGGLIAQIAELVQALHDCLTAWRRQLLPSRKQSLLNFTPLFGSQLLPDSLPLAELLLLRRRQIIPGLETLADSRLLVRRQVPEALVVLEELFLPLGRHILEALKHLGRQVVFVPGVDTRTHPVRA